MLFKKRSEYNLNYLQNSIFDKITFYNNISSNSVSSTLFFLFRNIVEIEAIHLQRYILLLWLCFGKVAKLFNFHRVLRLGVRYSSFYIGIKLTSGDLLQMFEFTVEKLGPFLKTKWQIKTQQTPVFLFILSDLNLFTGLKLTTGVFFYRVTKPLYLRFVSDNIEYLKYRLALVKF